MVEEKQKKSKFGSFLKRGKKSSETTKKKVLVKDVPKPVPAVKVALKSQPAPDPAADAPKVVDTPPVSLNAEKDKGGSWLSRTNYFREMSDWAFDVVDTDKSGCVDEKVSPPCFISIFETFFSRRLHISPMLRCFHNQ